VTFRISSTARRRPGPNPRLGARPFETGESLTPISLDREARLRPLALFLAATWRRVRLEPLLRAVHRLGWQLLPDHRLVIPQRFRDGSFGWAFQRSGRWERDDWRAIELLLAPAAVDRAAREGAAIVVYTHLGKGAIPPRALELLRGLARRDDLWICSVRELLDAALSMISPDAPIFRGLPANHIMTLA
jgi:hypothetical protein